MDVIFREDNADKSVALMESLLRCPIQSIQGKSAPSTELTIEYAKSYVEKWEKLSSKVKCTLVADKKFNIEYARNFIILVNDSAEHQSVWRYSLKDGIYKFVDLLPGKFEDGFTSVDFGTWVLNTRLLSHFCYIGETVENDFSEMFIYSDSGNLLDRIRVDEIDNTDLCYDLKITFWDESHLLLCFIHKETSEGKIIRYNFKEHKIVWIKKLENNLFGYGFPHIQLIDSKMFFVCKTEKNEILILIDEEGEMQRKEFADSRSKILNKHIYNMCFESEKCYLCCYDSDLNLLYKIALTEKYIHSWSLALLDNGPSSLGFFNTCDSIYQIYLSENPSVKFSKRNEEILEIMGADSDIGIICLTGSSEITVYDCETLEKISIHKLKGIVLESQKTEDGKFLIFTWKPSDWDTYSKEEPFIKTPGHVWIYQLEANPDAQT